MRHTKEKISFVHGLKLDSAALLWEKRETS
jgi:hypothetical protein